MQGKVQEARKYPFFYFIFFFQHQGRDGVAELSFTELCSLARLQ